MGDPRPRPWPALINGISSKFTRCISFSYILQDLFLASSARAHCKEIVGTGVLWQASEILLFVLNTVTSLFR